MLLCPRAAGAAITPRTAVWKGGVRTERLQRLVEGVNGVARRIGWLCSLAVCVCVCVWGSWEAFDLLPRAHWDALANYHDLMDAPHRRSQTWTPTVSLYTQTHANMNTHTRTHTHKNEHEHTHKHELAHRLTQTHTHTRTHTQTWTHTNRNTHWYTHTHTHRHRHKHAVIHTPAKWLNIV